MAVEVHISEEEAVRDFGALMRRVHSSETVVVDCADGSEATIKIRKPGSETTSERPRHRTIAESLEILRAIEAIRPLAVVDPESAEDLAAVHELYNAPMKSPDWD